MQKQLSDEQQEEQQEVRGKNKFNGPTTLQCFTEPIRCIYSYNTLPSLKYIKTHHNITHDTNIIKIC